MNYNVLVIFQTFSKLKRYSKQADFNPEMVGKVSGACRSICEWVLALEHYNEVYKVISPKLLLSPIWKMLSNFENSSLSVLK